MLTLCRPRWAPQPDPRRHLCDAEVLTTALVAARYFGGNLAQARRYMQGHWGQRVLHKSGFSRQLHQLRDVLAELFTRFGETLKHLNADARYVLDSFPVPGCHNARIGRSRLLTGKAYHGRCAGKRCWFYGVKVQVLATADGLPVACHLHPGSEADVTGLRQLDPDLPEGSVRYTDAGYTDYGHEDVFEDATGCQQQTARRANSKRPHAPARAFLIQHFRHGIETCFGGLTNRFLKKIHATSAAGFALKI
nr:IS982 family transposase [Hymenobacter sp. PAMC 26628]